MDRVQQVDEENEVIYLFIMFIPSVMVSKMSNMALFCIFYLRQQKIGHS